MMNIELKDDIKVEEYNNLREQVGWNKTDEKRVEKALKESAFIKKAVIDNEVVGMARAISDGLYVLIVDVVVSQKYQNKGIGKLLMNALLEDIKNSINTGESISVNLVSMKDKEEFYEKCGFQKIPYDYTGYGMKQKIEK